MNFIKFKTTFFLTLILSSIGIWVGCTSDSSTSSATTSSYKGAGSLWTVSFSDDNASSGTFSMSEQDSNLSLSGTYSTNSFGFITMTVTSSSNASVVAVNDTAIALKVPGVVTLIKPPGTSGSYIIPAVPVGSCPTSNFTYNWIGSKALDPATEDMMGTVSYNVGTSQISVLGFLLSNTTTTADIGPNTETLTCSSGYAAATGARGFFTSSGIMLVHLAQSDTDADSNDFDDADDRIAIAAPQENLGASANAFRASFAGTYSGVIFTESAGILAAKATIDTSNLTVESIDPATDIADGTITSTTMAIDQVNTPGNGQFRIQVGAGDYARCLALSNVNSSGKKLIFCAGEEPDAGSETKFFNLFFVER